jgi:predicted unusual protein kinase regulating ubiquinone biosynthesis (AarF/ABC1/UbiB family)
VTSIPELIMFILAPLPCLRSGKIRVGFLIQKVLALCLQYRVKLESHFASVLLAIGVLEGVGRSLDPELDILSAATPVIVKSHLFTTLSKRLTRVVVPQEES